ncbi:DUF3488 and transglutaminase-like domain-containing protein [Salinibacterium sp. SYSU T00001]|uniref:transglutaminase family protein n=1 Tax=Homoserinimonas sedimenticola TaxID=2986805 RepID=UPI0022363BC5|nr:DUF3488 and transglutaminase-like domain-containing protein [Salinibacterium sedimenticola]MCW4384887.1 DUF3488 and transglutaminase-like domain-containing protein [Salinibacterium sedimenticola]
MRDARPQPPVAPPWRSSAALALAIPLAFASYREVLQQNDWWFAIALTSTLVLGAAAGARALVPEVRRGLRASIPTLAAALTAVVVVSLGSAPQTTLFGLPTPATLEALAQVAGQGLASLAAQPAPAIADPGVILLFTAGAGFLAVLCDLWAATLRTPALTGCLLIPAALAPAAIVPIDDYFWIALAIVAWLLVLVAQRPSRGRRAWDVVGVVGGGVAAAIVATMIAPTPSASGGGSATTGSIRSGVNPVVTLGEDLRREETITALHYTTESGAGHYLRLTSVDRFTEEGWEGDPVPDPDSLPEVAPAPRGLSDAVLRETEVTAVEVSSLGGAWVPLPYPALGVEGLEQDAEWDPQLTALRLDRRSVRGTDFVATSLVLTPTPQQLQAAGTIVPEDLAPLAAADTAWPSVIAETAASVTAGSATSYERALALQEYLRSGPFEYSEIAPERDGYDDTSAGAVAAFLDVKSGYCVQFASAMALMARTLGIPSRIGLGFLPGEEVDTGGDEQRWRVTSDDLHAWPELYFEGVGWIPFEPTTQRGEPADYAESGALDELGAETPLLPDTPTPLPSASPSTQAPERGDVGAVDVLGDDDEAGVPLPVFVLLGLLALALLPALVREVLRRRRLGLVRRGRAGSELAWRELMETARDLEIPVSATATPRSNAAAIAAAMNAPDHDLDAVLGAVEGEAYRPAGSGAADVTSSVRAVLRRLHGASPARSRLAAMLWPRTLLERLVNAIS